MVWLCLGLIPLACLISLLLTAVVIRVSRAFGAFDSGGVAGQVKEAPRRVPNTGGIAIFWAIVLPMLFVMWLFYGLDSSESAAWRTDVSFVPADMGDHVAGLQRQMPLAFLVLGCLAWLHTLGLIDDRRPLGPWVKMVLMLVPAVAVPMVSTIWGGERETRLLTLLDVHVGGAWLSIAITALWFIVVTNAMNFMDNMDGLSAGVAGVAASLFLAAAVLRPQPQWFVAAVLALVVGACVGFLFYNAPRKNGAKVFMGDSGSLVLGFILAFLTTRTTYLPDEAYTFHTPYSVSSGVMSGGAWYALLMPLVILAVPLYDFTSVVIIRLSQGRSPLVGDLQHLSHRLVRRGLSKRAAVLTIWGLTAVTGVSGVLLASATPWQAVLIGAQVVVMLGVIAAFEYASASREPGA